MAKVINLSLKYVLFFFLLCFTLHSLGQSRYSIDQGKVKKRSVGIKFYLKQTRADFKVFRKNRKIEREDKKAQKRVLKRIKSLQDRKTWKRMKQSRKIAKRLNKYGTPDPFYKRIKHKIEMKINVL